MRFPSDAYAKMVAAEESSVDTRQVAKESAVEKTVLSESAIDDDEVQSEDTGDEEILVD